MNQPDHDENLLELDVHPPAEEGSLPSLLGALILQPHQMVPEEHLSVDHEEVVHTTEELPPPLANDGHVEQYALTVEVSDGLDEIEDLTPTLWLPTEDIAIVQNCHGTSGYNLLVAVDETVSVGLGVSSNELSTSVESIYEDAQDVPDGISTSESATEPEPLLSEIVNPVDQNVHHIVPENYTAHHVGYGNGGGPALVDETGLALVDETGPAIVDETGSALVDETDHYVDHGNGEGLALVEQHVQHVRHRDDEGLAFVDAQAAVLDAPLAEPEDEGEPVPLDLLAASPLLVTLGFERVQTAYEQWLVNMSHAVTLYQGNYYQFYQST